MLRAHALLAYHCQTRWGWPPLVAIVAFVAPRVKRVTEGCGFYLHAIGFDKSGLMAAVAATLVGLCLGYLRANRIF
jgi:hypothetical protein